jgi:hypothetical protein
MSDDPLLESLFAGALLRANCPTPEVLLLYQATLLNDWEAQPVRAHVTTCADCQAELAELAAPFASNPIARAFEAGVRWLHAVLQPVPLTPALALRGAEPRRLEYRAEAYQIALAITPTPGPRGSGQIEGQFSGAEDLLANTPGQSTLFQDGQALQTEAIDDLGFFAFDNVAPGLYRLELQVGNDRIVIEGVEVA